MPSLFFGGSWKRTGQQHPQDDDQGESWRYHCQVQRNEDQHQSRQFHHHLTILVKIRTTRWERRRLPQLLNWRRKARPGLSSSCKVTSGPNILPWSNTNHNASPFQRATWSAFWLFHKSPLYRVYQVIVKRGKSRFVSNSQTNIFLTYSFKPEPQCFSPQPPYMQGDTPKFS